jgi:hypothetical protein
MLAAEAMPPLTHNEGPTCSTNLSQWSAFTHYCQAAPLGEELVLRVVPQSGAENPGPLRCAEKSKFLSEKFLGNADMRRYDRKDGILNSNRP